MPMVYPRLTNLTPMLLLLFQTKNYGNFVQYHLVTTLHSFEKLPELNIQIFLTSFMDFFNIPNQLLWSLAQFLLYSHSLMLVLIWQI